MINTKYPGKGQQILKQIRNNPNKCCWQDGDSKAYDGYEGMMALSAKSSTRPLVIGRNREALAEADGKPYAGCYVNCFVDIFVYDSSGIGVSAGLAGVQFWQDGDSFGGGRPVDADEFDVADGAEADDFV